MSRYLFWILSFTLVGLQSGRSETTSTKVPDEFYLGEIPGLAPLGESRATWFFLRPPLLWTMNRLVRLDRLRWPQWDTNQNPFSLVPQQAGFWVTLFDSENKVLKRFELKNPLTPNKSPQLKDLKPAKFQIDTSLEDGRVVVKSGIYKWIERRQVFQCKERVPSDQKLSKSRSVKACVETLMQIPSNSQDQWYAEVIWPRMKDADWKEWISENDRNLRSGFKKGGHAYEARREEGAFFQVLAGVTEKEKIQKIDFPLAEVQKNQMLTTAATREEKSKRLDIQNFSNGASLEILSFAADSIDARELKMPSESSVGLRVQFVASTDDQFRLRETEFEEARTGFQGILRPWALSLYANYNQITSNRGESDSFVGLPGIDVKFNWQSLGLKPYAFFETGTYHQGSTLSISEFQVGTYRHFDFLQWLEPGIGYHHYSLSGRNPGSSRLGTVDFVTAGAQAVSVTESGFLRGQMQLLISNSLGYGASLNWGRFLDYRKKDLRFFWGPSVGFYRYASKASNRLQVEETFTEDRWKIGLEFGMAGPDYFDGR